MSKFVRSNPNSAGTPRLPGVQQQRLYGSEVAMGEPYQLHGNTELTREIESSLEIIAQERLMEVEAQAKSFLTRAKAEADKILGKSNAQVREMLAQAQSEVDGIRESAYEEGFKAGFQEGYTDATAQVTSETQELLQGAQVLVDGAYLAEKRVMKHFESRTLELIRHIVRQILHREMSDSPATLMGMIHRAIESLYLNGKVQVVVSAQVIHELRSYATATEQSVDGLRRFEFIADPVLERHQIYIVGQESCFDLSPDTQTDLLLAAMEPHLSLSREVPDPVDALQQEPTTPHTATAEPEALESPELPHSVETPVADAPLSELDAGLAEVIQADLALENSTPVAEPVSELGSEVVSEITAEPDPVAWEEFPPEIQQLDGFPQEAEPLNEPVNNVAGSPSGLENLVASISDVMGDPETQEETLTDESLDPMLESPEPIDPDQEAL